MAQTDGGKRSRRRKGVPIERHSENENTDYIHQIISDWFGQPTFFSIMNTFTCSDGMPTMCIQIHATNSMGKCEHINCPSLKHTSSNWLGCAGECVSVCLVQDSNEMIMMTITKAKRQKKYGSIESQQLRMQTNTAHIPEHIRHQTLISNEPFKIHHVVTWKLALNLFKIDWIQTKPNQTNAKCQPPDRLFFHRILFWLVVR